MSFIIDAISTILTTVFVTIPSACCDLITSLFTSTVPAQVVKDQAKRRPLNKSRAVVDQTQKGANPDIGGLRQRHVGSGSTTSTTTTQPKAPVQPQPGLRPALRDPDDKNPRPRRKVTFAEPGVIAQQQPSLISPSTNAATQTNTSTSSSTNSQPVGGSSSPQAVLSLTEDQAMALAIAESLKPQGLPVHSGPAHRMMPSDLSDEEALALATKNSMQKEQNVDVPQVGLKVPLRNFIEAHQTQNSRGEAIPRSIAAREKLTALSTIYPVYQSIKGDGNCFYTSFAVDLLCSFNNKTDPEKDMIMKRIRECSADANAKADVLAGLQRMRTGGRFGATPKLMLDFVVCLRYVGADYINAHRNDFFRDVRGEQVFDDEQIGECLTNMLVMGTDTDAAAPRAIAAAFGHGIRIVNYFSTDRLRNYQLAQYYDITARGEEEFPGNWTSEALPEGPHPDRILLYSGGHYSLLHKR